MHKGIFGTGKEVVELGNDGRLSVLRLAEGVQVFRLAETQRQPLQVRQEARNTSHVFHKLLDALHGLHRRRAHSFGQIPSDASAAVSLAGRLQKLQHSLGRDFLYFLDIATEKVIEEPVRGVKNLHVQSSQQGVKLFGLFFRFRAHRLEARRRARRAW